MDKEIEGIADCLRTLKFRRQLLGGIREKDIWQQLKHLEECYEEVLREELYQHQKQVLEKDIQIRLLKDHLSMLGYEIPKAVERKWS